METNTRNRTKSYDKLQQFLDNERDHSRSDPWTRIRREVQTQYLREYTERYANVHNLNEDERTSLETFLVTFATQGHLSRSKDVVFDRQTRIIKDIPGILFDRTAKRATLRYADTTFSITAKRLRTTLKQNPVNILC